MGTPAFLLCYGFIIADIQGDKPDFQSSQTKKQGDKVYFKPLCGPHRRQNRAKSASYPAPTGTKGTRVPCILGTQARQGCPIPGCNPTPQHAKRRRQASPVPSSSTETPTAPIPASSGVGSGRRPRASSAQRQARPPKTSSMGCAAPGDLQRKVRGTAHGKQHQLPRRSQTVKQTDIQTPPVQYGRMTPSSFAIVCAGAQFVTVL